MSESEIKILVIGASGMLGSTLLRYFSGLNGIDVVATARSFSSITKLPAELHSKIFLNVDAENSDHLLKVFSDVQPDVVINCVGVVKQLSESEDPLTAIPLNSLVPHRLARFAATTGARLIHISTDCVFSGNKGSYAESDLADASDLYGRSKLLGEVDYSNAITLRTSLIGHELNSTHSLIDWFLSQQENIKGFRKAVFSGLPTVEIGRVIHEFVLPNPQLHGLYHLSVDPINKFELLELVAKVYKKQITITPDDSLVIDRSLDSTLFREATGFVPKPWPDLVKAMHDFG